MINNIYEEKYRKLQTNQQNIIHELIHLDV